MILPSSSASLVLITLSNIFVDESPIDMLLLRSTSNSAFSVAIFTPVSAVLDPLTSSKNN